MAHEKLGDTVEELDGVVAMLTKRLADLDEKRAALAAELQMVMEKRQRIAEGKK